MSFKNVITMGSDCWIKDNQILLAGEASPAGGGEDEGPGNEAISFSALGCRVAVTLEMRAGCRLRLVFMGGLKGDFC